MKITLTGMTIILANNKIITDAEIDVEANGTFWYVDEDGNDIEVYIPNSTLVELL